MIPKTLAAMAVLLLGMGIGQCSHRRALAEPFARCQEQFNELHALAQKCTDKLAECISLLPEDRR